MRLYCFNRILLRELIFLFLLKADVENTFEFVKIISLKNANCVLALRKRLFCNAKPTLLPCKRAAFGMQNNRFCNALIMKWLCDRCACEKYLHFYRLFTVYKTRNRGEVGGWGNIMKYLRVMRSECLFTADLEQIKLYVLPFVLNRKKLDIWANDCLLQWAERIKL